MALTYIVLGLSEGSPIENQFLFVITGILGASYFSMVLSLISAMTSHTNKSAGLISALGIPMLIPVIFPLAELSLNSIIGVGLIESTKTIGVITLLHLLLFIIGFILFPVLWKE
jgi:heme exporter protein B